MNYENLLAVISRDFLKIKKVYTYRMKKVADMTEDEVIRNCHFYCEENNLIAEWNEFREKVESNYYYCSYMKQYIDVGLCHDVQMIMGGYIKASTLVDIAIDKEKCSDHCSKCKYSL